MRISNPSPLHAQLTGVQPNQHHIPIANIVVDAAGGGDYTTLAAADTAAAVGDVIFVVTGSYAGANLARDAAKWIFAPGCVITSDLTLSGFRTIAEFGSVVDVQGLLTLSGARAAVVESGPSLTDGLLLSGALSGYFGTGAGSLHSGGTVRHGISVTGAGCTVTDTSCSTQSGGGTNFDGVNVASADVVLDNVRVNSSDDVGIASSAGADRVRVVNCFVEGADAQAYNAAHGKWQFIGCRYSGTPSRGFELQNTADNSQVIGCAGEGSTGDGTLIALGTDNCVVVGNRFVGDAITDNSGTATVTGNNTT